MTKNKLSNSTEGGRNIHLTISYDEKRGYGWELSINMGKIFPHTWLKTYVKKIMETMEELMPKRMVPFSMPKVEEEELFGESEGTQ